MIPFEGMSSLTKIMTPPSILFLSLRNGLANPSTENWPLGNEESMTIKKSMLFLIIYLSCSNLLFIALIFKFPKTNLLEFLVFRVLIKLYKDYIECSHHQ